MPKLQPDCRMLRFFCAPFLSFPSASLCGKKEQSREFPQRFFFDLNPRRYVNAFEGEFGSCLWFFIWPAGRCLQLTLFFMNRTFFFSCLRDVLVVTFIAERLRRNLWSMIVRLLIDALAFFWCILLAPGRERREVLTCFCNCRGLYKTNAIGIGFPLGTKCKQMLVFAMNLRLLQLWENHCSSVSNCKREALLVLTL
jgi:hypothetical protein